MRNVPIFRSAGYTLVELVIVVTILATIAAIAVPNMSSGIDRKLDLAAEEFAAAMRFARSEAIRTATPYGFRQQSSAKRIRVFRMDTATSPATKIYDVYHPITKQLFDLDLDTQSAAAADNLNRDTVFLGTCNQTGSIFFDRNGTPRCTDPDTVLLEHFQVELFLGNDLRVVSLDGLTGRVSVQ